MSAALGVGHWAELSPGRRLMAIAPGFIFHNPYWQRFQNSIIIACFNVNVEQILRMKAWDEAFKLNE